MVQATLTRKPRVTMLAALMLATAMATAADAQQAPPAAETFQPPQIEAFAAAVVEVQGVRQELQARLPAAGSAEEAARLEAEAMASMVEAVEDSGLSVDEYNRILHAAQADPALHARIVEAIEGSVE
jgi:hypothetical protein